MITGVILTIPAESLACWGDGVRSGCYAVKHVPDTIKITGSPRNSYSTFYLDQYFNSCAL